MEIDSNRQLDTSCCRVECLWFGVDGGRYPVESSFTEAAQARDNLPLGSGKVAVVWKRNCLSPQLEKLKDSI